MNEEQLTKLKEQIRINIRTCSTAHFFGTLKQTNSMHTLSFENSCENILKLILNETIKNKNNDINTK